MIDGLREKKKCHRTKSDFLINVQAKAGSFFGKPFFSTKKNVSIYFF